MAEIVATIALSHAPGLTGWLDKAPRHEQDSLTGGFRQLGEMVRATEPDVIIGFANDHVLNMPPHDIDDFCVGTASAWEGPAEWFKDWVALPHYEVGGHPEVAAALAAGLRERGVNLRTADQLLFDDNWSVPLYYLTPGYDVPLVPVHMNCIVPPLPDARHCYEVGRMTAEIVRAHLPAGLRVVVMGTGGLSHDPGGPKYFDVDEAFDRWFLGLLESGDRETLLAELTLEKMMAAGDGGTSELLSWMIPMGAASEARARTVCYEPAVELRCGMGCVYWDMLPAAAQAA